MTGAEHVPPACQAWDLVPGTTPSSKGESAKRNPQFRREQKRKNRHKNGTDGNCRIDVE